MWEIVLIFLVVLLLFGAKRLPEIGSSLGKGIREFKGSLREIESELKLPEEPRRTPPGGRVTGGEEGSGSTPSGGSESSEAREDGSNGEPRKLTPSG